MEKHELYCLSNKENHVACLNCYNCSQTKIDLEFKDNGRQSNGFYCSHFDKCIYNEKMMKAKALLDKYPETFEDQMPMPKECQFKKTELLLDDLFK